MKCVIEVTHTSHSAMFRNNRIVAQHFDIDPVATTLWFTLHDHWVPGSMECEVLRDDGTRETGLVVGDRSVVYVAEDDDRDWYGYAMLWLTCEYETATLPWN